MIRLLLALLCSICMFALPLQVNASTVEQLLAENKLTITSSIVTKDSQIVGQPLTISIEVATDRWFAKGTSIKSFDLADTVILPLNELAINGSKRVNGQTWTTQTREITLYPTQAKTYQLPAIEVSISVNTEKHGVVEGITTTNEQTFAISLPDELSSIEHFIVSPSVELDIEGEFTSEQTYALGDAVSQTITIIANDTPAMMLPPIQLAELDGISIYHKPSQLFDKSNRGSLTGTRIESFTYIFEQAGSYQIPERKIFWWNTSTNQLEEIIIPASKWDVAGGFLSSNNSQSINKDIFSDISLKFLLEVALMLAILLFIYRYKSQGIALYTKISRSKQRKLQNAYLLAVKKKDYLSAYHYLSRLVELANFDKNIQHLPLMLQLKQLAFEQEGITCSLASFGQVEAKQLLAQMKKPTKIKKDNITIIGKIKLNS